MGKHDHEQTLPLSQGHMFGDDLTCIGCGSTWPPAIPCVTPPHSNEGKANRQGRTQRARTPIGIQVVERRNGLRCHPLRQPRNQKGSHGVAKP